MLEKGDGGDDGSKEPEVVLGPVCVRTCMHVCACVRVLGVGTCILQRCLRLMLRHLNLKKNIFPGHKIICNKPKAQFQRFLCVSGIKESI